jgi:hypothetical protein
MKDVNLKEGEEEVDPKNELQIKKLMTVARSKYYMLKVNHPKLAEIIDNEPLLSPEEELKAHE